MWNNGKYLLFRHIADLFYSDQEFALDSLPKFTMDQSLLPTVGWRWNWQPESWVGQLQHPWSKVVMKRSWVLHCSVQWWMIASTAQKLGHWLNMAGREIISSSCTPHRMMSDSPCWKIPCIHTFRTGGRVHLHAKKSKMPEGKCSFPAKPMRAWRFLSIPTLRPYTFYLERVFSMSWVNDSCRMYWKITFGIQKVDGQITQQPTNLVTMI